jgi:hypothetical protein
LAPFAAAQQVGSHASRVEGAAPAEVAEVETKGESVWSTVGHLKVIPEAVSPGVGINPQEQVVLEFGKADSGVKVAALEVRGESEGQVVEGGVGALEGTVVDHLLLVDEWALELVRGGLWAGLGAGVSR